MDAGFFDDGIPKVVDIVREEDDILFVMDRDGEWKPVWSDRRIEVYSRYQTHAVSLKWRRKEYDGDPRPPKAFEVVAYHRSLEEALADALQEQSRLSTDIGEQVPVYLRTP